MNQALKQGAERSVWVLAVDDEPYNLEILEELLQDAGLYVDVAVDGKMALDMLHANPNKYHTVLLDRMMPEMDGLDVLRAMKVHNELRFVPVIMQTAKATVSDIQEGLNQGVIYYLTKPFERQTLLNIVSTSVASYQQHLDLCAGLPLIQHASPQREFGFRTLEDARSLAVLLSSLCPDQKRVITGLSELLVNAVEHGILDIGYDTKSTLLANGRWREEVEQRLAMPEYRHKHATIEVDQGPTSISFSITDPGNGFDSEKYLQIDPGRAINTHGRGIVVAKVMSFDDLEFVPPGNKVIATVKATGEQR